MARNLDGDGGACTQQLALVVSGADIFVLEARWAQPNSPSVLGLSSVAGETQTGRRESCARSSWIFTPLAMVEEPAGQDN